MDSICRFLSPLGGVTLASDGKALTGLWFDGQKHFAAGLSADCLAADCAGELPVFEEAVRWLEAYFSGRAPTFTPPLSLRGTPFCRAVWAALLEIPYGATASYGEIARRVARTLGKERVSARAVGGAVGRNPVSLIVPCHRVIGADGRLTGYAGGLDRKRRLLQMEAASRPHADAT